MKETISLKELKTLIRECIKEENPTLSKLNEKKYDIECGHLGNGLTFWNKSEEEDGDYKKIAHVDRKRNITFYEKLPSKIKKDIEKIAKGKNTQATTTQPDKKIFDESEKDWKVIFDWSKGFKGKVTTIDPQGKKRHYNLPKAVSVLVKYDLADSRYYDDPSWHKEIGEILLSKKV